MRAFRLLMPHVPKPTRVTLCPFFSDDVMPSVRASIAVAAAVRVMPASVAILPINSCLFMRFTSFRS